ncbi:MAG: hypothetical protein SD837_14255 [Candidatus Electrothrix scaldis]|nr:MAG: hypothetical protein SD837_14255 [Candidatus Electrothrix sp. GW3-3]
MLLPREKPFLTGLNSYYLDIEKFIQHLQGEIGSGCLYCNAADQELLVYFDEYDIVRGVTQNSGEHARVSEQLQHVLIPLQKKNFQVTIYYLDPTAIFFWGQMPAFRRAEQCLSSDKVTLPDLIFRLSQKEFSGFIEVNVEGKEYCAVLFFHEGQRRGGSYYWGTGGLSPSDSDYNTLLGMLQKNNGTYNLGYFTSDPLSPLEEVTLDDEEGNKSPEKEPAAEKEVDSFEEQKPSELHHALNEFLAVFAATLRSKKGKAEPLMDLKLKFIDFSEIYPYLDPYNNLCKIEDDATVSIAKEITEKEAAQGIIDCAWMVIEDNKLHKKFRHNLKVMDRLQVFQDQGIELER